MAIVQHTRKSHFLGTKLRALRKRNGLTLEELSARCVQLDSQSAPSVSYLSMFDCGGFNVAAVIDEPAAVALKQR